MPIELKMPALSPTMEEGKLSKWLVKEGDTVVSGDILAEIETDKATMEFEAVDEGTIGKIVIAEGTEGVKVGTVIAVMAGEGEDLDTSSTSAATGEDSKVPGEAKKTEAPEQQRKADESDADKGDAKTGTAQLASEVMPATSP